MRWRDHMAEIEYKVSFTRLLVACLFILWSQPLVSHTWRLRNAGRVLGWSETERWQTSAPWCTPSRLDYKIYKDVQRNGMGRAWGPLAVLGVDWSMLELRTIPSWSELKGMAMDLHWQQWDGESETIWALPVVKICHHQPVEKWWLLPRVWCRRMPLCHSDISLARPLLIPLILMNWQEATCFRRQHIPIHLFLHWRWFCHSLSGWMRHQRQIPPLWLFLEKASSFEKMGVPIFLL